VILEIIQTLLASVVISDRFIWT